MSFYISSFFCWLKSFIQKLKSTVKLLPSSPNSYKGIGNKETNYHYICFEMKCHNDVAQNLKYISDFKSDAQNLLHSEIDNSLSMKFPLDTHQNHNLWGTLNLLTGEAVHYHGITFGTLSLSLSKNSSSASRCFNPTLPHSSRQIALAFNV